MKSASILVGNGTSYFDKEKALVEVEDKLLIHYVAERISDSVDRVIVEGKNEIQAEKILAKVPFIDDLAYDVFQGYSIVSAMFSLFNSSPKGLTLLIGCDRALVEPKVINYLFDEINGYDAILPRYDDGSLEYFLSVFRVREGREATKKALENDEEEISSVLNNLDVKYVPVERLREIDNELKSFIKINHPNKLGKLNNGL